MKIKHEKALCLFTSVLFLLYMLIGMALTSCGRKEEPTGNIASGKETSTASEAASSEEKTLPAGDSSFSDLLPKPVADNEADWGCGLYYSSISYEAICDYLSALKNEGWYLTEDPNTEFAGKGTQNNSGRLHLLSSCERPMVTELPVGISRLQLSDGQNLLQLLITIESKEAALNNSVLARSEEGISASYVYMREEALTKAEALALLQPEIDRLARENNLYAAKGEVIGLFEIFIRDSYEKMGLQAYAAITDRGVVGSFLLCRGRTLSIIGYLTESCVADLDGNGSYELLDLAGYGSGIYRIELSIYEYGTPIYFSSLTKVLYKKYGNCFVPEKGYGVLKFLKQNDSEVRLIGMDMESGRDIDYGRLVLDGYYSAPEKLEQFPYQQWKDAFDQSRLSAINKIIPEDAPEITLSIDGRKLDYIITKTKWDGYTESYDSSVIFQELTEKAKPNPIYRVSSGTEAAYQIEIDFGSSIPDTIRVQDMMLDDNGNSRYGSKPILEREVEILDDSRVQFGLVQHMAYYLSSHSKDYEKSWNRLFHVICTWEKNEAVYSFLVNTKGTFIEFE